MNNDPEITFDPAKEATNQEKHGLSLALLEAILDGETITRMDTRRDYGEPRFATYGYVDGRLYVAVWSPRDSVYRAISVRKANSREQARYG